MATLAANALEVQCQSCGANRASRRLKLLASASSAACRLWPKQNLPIRFWRPEVYSLSHHPTRGEPKPSQLVTVTMVCSQWAQAFRSARRNTRIYLPFWTYDTNTTSYYTGERGDYYYVTETYYDATHRETGEPHQTGAAHALVLRFRYSLALV